MTRDEFRIQRWLAVYGASFAFQIHDMMIRGMGAPDADKLCYIIDEAEAIADMELEQHTSLDHD